MTCFLVMRSWLKFWKSMNAARSDSDDERRIMGLPSTSSFSGSSWSGRSSRATPLLRGAVCSVISSSSVATTEAGWSSSGTVCGKYIFCSRIVKITSAMYSCGGACGRVGLASETRHGQR